MNLDSRATVGQTMAKLFELKTGVLERLLQSYTPNHYVLIVHRGKDPHTHADVLNKVKSLFKTKTLEDLNQEMCHNDFLLMIAESKEEAFRIYESFPQELTRCRMFCPVGDGVSQLAKVEKEKYPYGRIVHDNRVLN